jgi:hypothetical protein
VSFGGAGLDGPVAGGAARPENWLGGENIA